jgi:hypothetical protein
MKTLQEHVWDKVVGEETHQVWITKVGEAGEDTAPMWVELELWREEDPDAPARKRKAKLLKTIRYDRTTL